MRVRSLFFTLIIAGICYSSRGQQAELPKGQISASEILQKNLIATGGLEAHKVLESLVASGDLHLGFTHRMADYKFYYKAPSNDVLQVDMVSHGSTWTGHRADQPIHRSTFEGPGMINGVSMEIVERAWRTLLAWDFCCSYSRIDLVGLADVDKRRAYGVRFTPKHGDSFVCFYDRETFLLVRMDQVQRFRMNQKAPQVAYAVETYFRDYRTEGPIKLPLVIAIPRDEGDLVFETGKVRPGEAIPDSIFE